MTTARKLELAVILGQHAFILVTAFKSAKHLHGPSIWLDFGPPKVSSKKESWKCSSLQIVSRRLVGLIVVAG